MQLSFASYPFTPILGWSISRYEVFDKCKRQYFYTYYSKYVAEVPAYKMKRLRELTSIPLETGNVVHDVLEAFLKRLQKSDRNIDEGRFFDYAHELVKRYFSEKTFIEQYYNGEQRIDLDRVIDKIDTALRNFMNSHCYNWIFMVALHNRDNWIIEPAGYGETRLDGMKVYCKMDFLLPVDECIYILDWKTGNRDQAKHAQQLIGYSAAASSLFAIPWNRIFPRIVYLYPAFDEMEIRVTDEDRDRFFARVREQTEVMYQWCSDIENNIPLSVEAFTKSPSPSLCSQCRFRELCFPDCRPCGREKTNALDGEDAT
ncbi:MAG: PD-(D/E)XK nuclease family protein [Chitinispirillaceae bacterium]|nr:PD-(D/E)XK nuclease family protein [Chitinispirillaceae bacterium]